MQMAMFTIPSDEFWLCPDGFSSGTAGTAIVMAAEQRGTYDGSSQATINVALIHQKRMQQLGQLVK